MWTATTGQAKLLQRKNFEEKAKRLAGGPHDEEFFSCYLLYLEQTITKVLENPVTFECIVSRNKLS